jgi:Arc/MetJ-type ribon-helix-helix transcriptional regulator
MGAVKIAIRLDERILAQVDWLVRSGRFPSRSRVIQVALAEKLERLRQGRLARECAKLDPAEEKAFAEEGISDWVVAGLNEIAGA